MAYGKVKEKEPLGPRGIWDNWEGMGEERPLSWQHQDVGMESLTVNQGAG